MIKRALVIDDDEVYCCNLVNTLERCLKNCAVYTARNGKEASKIMESTPVDFVITDLNMPEMGGYEFVSHAKANYPDIPIVVMTGTKTPEVEERLRALGVPRCIEKPFNAKEMVPLILSELRGDFSANATQSDPGFT